MFFTYKTRLLAMIVLMAALLLAVGCSSSGGQEPAVDNTQNEADHDDSDHGHEEEEHDESEPHGRIPNENGAVIHIVTPADGDVFQHGDQIIVEVETENFDLSQEGYHWHVFVNDASWGMIMGGSANYALNGVEPGEHEISVYLSIPTHEEYEDGDSVTITVEE